MAGKAGVQKKSGLVGGWVQRQGITGRKEEKVQMGGDNRGKILRGPGIFLRTCGAPHIKKPKTWGK